ncbi:hypothetical protein DQ04_14481010 [Trypanosoma grayi]|uniref:hypothetical protein n=1 Tax=Trypanosoma grayi TaxID=71804 RepID=UPI0004F4885C|nr:hypothetical protein DQ04_14481010 [Trypanosoma grayi]KEG06349.1 hypothetical protein DQ04_14481010 [Trypanosoma grayi]
MGRALIQPGVTSDKLGVRLFKQQRVPRAMRHLRKLRLHVRVARNTVINVDTHRVTVGVEENERIRRVHGVLLGVDELLHQRREAPQSGDERCQEAGVDRTRCHVAQGDPLRLQGHITAFRIQLAYARPLLGDVLVGLVELRILPATVFKCKEVHTLIELLFQGRNFLSVRLRVTQQSSPLLLQALEHAVGFKR